jgi:hypothetical protein
VSVSIVTAFVEALVRKRAVIVGLAKGLQIVLEIHCCGIPFTV